MRKKPGLTGRKIIIDTYGGYGAHGGNAFSGKDPTKGDRSAAYNSRQMARSVVASGLMPAAWYSFPTHRCGQPLPLFVDAITNVIKIVLDCRPNIIAQSLALREPKYQETAAYRRDQDNIKFFKWENAKSLKVLLQECQPGISSLVKSNFLTKWVQFCRSREILSELSEWDHLLSGDLDACDDILMDASRQWTWQKKPIGQLPRLGIESRSRPSQRIPSEEQRL